MNANGKLDELLQIVQIGHYIRKTELLKIEKSKKS